MAFIPQSGLTDNPAALDLLLKRLLASQQFGDLQHKNWIAISKTVPGTTPRQCQRRYEELMKEGLCCSPGMSTSNLTRATRSADENTDSERPSRPGSAKNKVGKNDKDGHSSKTPHQRHASADLGPVMVIHVCDEAKNLKQDFNCPRDLLIEEMKYFAEYLSTDAQRWEEVDISVHCDVQIFDWLMKFVKRTMKSAARAPVLEATNVISILISSDFLKMDNLVDECIRFCHDNMSTIVAAPCNMNCINDKLVTRIAELFTHKEADEVKDRKDKFKSKLFQKKIEQLFDDKVTNKDSPESAATLYRCSVCRKLLTKNLQSNIRCLQSRLNIGMNGNLIYYHSRDTNWDVNDYICELKTQLKTWRDVYWRLWGICNYLSCSSCGESFPCSELGHCKYHPEKANFENTCAVGTFPCCGQQVLRFDPAQPNKGCKLRDHIVKLDTGEGPVQDGRPNEKQAVYHDLLSYRDAICVPFQRLISVTDGDDDIDVFALDENALGMRTNPVTKTILDSVISDADAKPRLEALTVERERSFDDDFAFSDDDEIGDLEEERPTRKLKAKKSRVTVDPQAILMDPPTFGSTKSRKWDSSRSLRWNQDAQREEDQIRMNNIISYLSKLRLTSDKLEKPIKKEYAGGIFSRIEAQWRAINMPPPKAPNTFQIRNKPRIGTLPK